MHAPFQAKEKGEEIRTTGISIPRLEMPTRRRKGGVAGGDQIEAKCLELRVFSRPPWKAIGNDRGVDLRAEGSSGSAPCQGPSTAPQSIPS